LLAIDIKTSDLYGFGYLLSTLIAIKAHDKDIFPRLMRSTLEVSLAGAVLGNLAGLLIAMLKPQIVFGFSDSRAVARGAVDSQSGQIVAATIGDAYLHSKRVDAKPLSTDAAETLSSAIEIFEAEPRAALATGTIAGTGIRILGNNDGTIAILRGDGVGGELLLFNPDARRQITILVPDPTQSHGLGAAAFSLFQSESARWLIISSPEPPGSIITDTTLGLFRAASKLPEIALVAATTGQGPEVQLHGRGATATNLTALRQTLPDLQVSFGGHVNTNIAEGARDAALLQLDRASIDRLTAKLASPSEPATMPTECVVSREPVSPSKLDKLAMLAFLRYEIAEPLVSSIAKKQSPAALAPTAKLAGLSIQPCLLGNALQWRLAALAGNEGTYFFSPAGDPSRLVHSYAAADGLAIKTGGELHNAWGSMLLAIAPEERTLRILQRSSFGVMSQTTLRSMGEAPGRVLQLRASRFSAPDPGPEVDLVISTDRIEPFGVWQKQVVSAVSKAGVRYQLADREKAEAGYEKESSPSILYLDQLFDKRYATLWLRRKPLAESK
jgi:hypothetical protein